MSEPLRVLLIEDSEVDAELLLMELRRGGYEVASERVDTPEAMSRALAEGAWDIILCDYTMPRFDGLAALQLMKATGADIPFIIVSGHIGEDIAVQAMKSGASDYLLKGNLARLIPAVDRELREAEIRAERRRAEAQRDRLLIQLREINERLVMSRMQIQDQAEEFKRQSAEMNATSEAMAEGLLILNARGEIVRMNSVAAGLLGYSTITEEPMPMSDWVSRVQTTDGKAFKQEDLPCVKALRGEKVRGAAMLVTASAQAKPVLVSTTAVPIPDDRGRTIGAVAVFSVIT